MPKQRPNPTNSPIIQSLLDLQKTGIDTRDLLKQVVAKENKDILRKANALFDAHQYPNKVLKYAQLKNFNECRALINLGTLKGGHNALEIFILMCQVVGQELTFQLSTKDISNLTGFSNKTIISAIKLLKEYGFIATVRESSNKIPAIQMLNPNVVNVGKPKSCERFNELAEDMALNKFKQLNTANNNIRIERRTYIDNDNKQVKYSTLIEIPRSETEENEIEIDEMLNKGFPLPTKDVGNPYK